MLRLAKRRGYLDTVPEIDMPRAAGACKRFLSADEIARLLAAEKPRSLGVVSERVGLARAKIALKAQERADEQGDLRHTHRHRT